MEWIAKPRDYKLDTSSNFEVLGCNTCLNQCLLVVFTIAILMTIENMYTVVKTTNKCDKTFII